MDFWDGVAGVEEEDVLHYAVLVMVLLLITYSEYKVIKIWGKVTSSRSVHT